MNTHEAAQGELRDQAHLIDVHVGQRVRERRVLLGASQEQLAESVGLTFQQVQKYERGANRISAGRLQQIANYLGVRVEFFFEGLPSADPHIGPRDVSRRERILKFALTHDGTEWNEACISADPRTRKLALEVLRLGDTTGG